MIFFRNTVFATLAMIGLVGSVTEVATRKSGPEFQLAFNTRVYSVSKQTAPNAAQAALIAERANPGWKVKSIKEMNAVWHMVLVKG